MAKQRPAKTPVVHSADPNKIGAQISPEAWGGLLLIAATICALAIANSPWRHGYDAALHLELGVFLGGLTFQQSVLHWVNDGLMAIFFLGVGLEIKHEVLTGHLRVPAAAALPVAGAIGGMVVPALIYVAINRANPDALAGWAIPSATDIGFAVGVLALLGSRVPQGLKVFLVALAIIDDLGAIVIIAMFYTDHLSYIALGLAALLITALVAANRSGLRQLGPYLLLGLVLWAGVLQSGVHATLAGVALAFVIPAGTSARGGPPPSLVLEHALKPWITYFILPVFAFANAGLSFDGLDLADLLQPVPWGIFLGLVVGKPVGVLGGAALAVALGLAHWPKGADALSMLGIGILCGIGFTMSLFIGTLAFDQVQDLVHMRLGVIAASTIAVLLGSAILILARPKVRS